MEAAGLVSFALSWRTALSAFHDLGQMLSFRSAAASKPFRIEAPMSWFVVGQIVSLVALAWLGHASFGMPVWETAVAVALSFWLALVACRVTGETDTTPVGAMGKVTQLIFGGLSPGHVNVNLMSANITAGAATSAADLLTDLKSGYLLGANPRQQFLAQFSGIFVGTVVSVLTFAILVPNAQVLGTDQFPAPAAQTWSAVAIALGQGLASLESVKLWLIFAGGVVGVLLTLAPVLFPKYPRVPEPGKSNKRHDLADGKPAHWRLDAAGFARSRRAEGEHLSEITERAQRRAPAQRKTQQSCGHHAGRAEPERPLHDGGEARNFDDVFRLEDRHDHSPT